MWLQDSQECLYFHFSNFIVLLKAMLNTVAYRVINLLSCKSLYYRHSFLRYPAQSQKAFGQTRGCFQLPSSVKPRKNIKCSDILPLDLSDNEPNRQAMLDSDPLVHPDTANMTRYCLGTRMQMKEDGKGSHKAVECSYHDLDLSEDGKMLKSMTQEAMQVCRKFRTIQQVRKDLNFLQNCMR